MFKKLSVGALVIDQIIDYWAEVLNYEEKFKAPASHSHLLMGTRVVICKNEKHIDIFRKNMQAGMYGNEKLFYLRSFNMVLFLILEVGYFYLLVFKMKNPAITLIHNGAENFTRRGFG
ncbi:hypothetical protein Hanom_Chr01g00045881 [Helianthus anomalus]